MNDLIIQNTSGAIVSVDIKHEFTLSHIQQVLDNCDKIKTLSNMENFVEVWRKEHSGGILDAIQRIFGDKIKLLAGSGRSADGRKKAGLTESKESP